MTDKNKAEEKKKARNTKKEPITVPQIKATFDEAITFLVSKRKQKSPKEKQQ